MPYPFSELGEFECDLEGRFSVIRTQECNLGNFICDIMVAATNADLAILNSGTLRSDCIHPAGKNPTASHRSKRARYFENQESSVYVVK